MSKVSPGSWKLFRSRLLSKMYNFQIRLIAVKASVTLCVNRQIPISSISENIKCTACNNKQPSRISLFRSRRLFILQGLYPARKEIHSSRGNIWKSIQSRCYFSPKGKESPPGRVQCAKERKWAAEEKKRNAENSSPVPTDIGQFLKLSFTERLLPTNGRLTARALDNIFENSPASGGDSREKIP